MIKQKHDFQKGSCFRCESCGREFIEARTLEDAIKERDVLFPEQKDEDTVRVCDDCFTEIFTAHTRMAVVVK